MGMYHTFKEGAAYLNSLQRRNTDFMVLIFMMRGLQNHFDPTLILDRCPGEGFPSTSLNTCTRKSFFVFCFLFLFCFGGWVGGGSKCWIEVGVHRAPMNASWEPSTKG